jgi:hypothetical protein
VFESPPPAPIEPGSPSASVPEINDPLVKLPVTALMSAEPLQPLMSAFRCMIPTRFCVMSRR